MTWRIAGTYAGSCSCQLVCPCAMDGKPLDPQGRGECRGAIVFRVTEGNLNSVDLAGVDFAFYNYFPSNLTSGNWKVGLVVDDKASDDQAQGLERIISGQEGGAFAELAQFIGEYVGMQRGSVTFSDGDQPSGRAGDLGEFRVEPLRGVDGNPTTVKNAMFGFAPEFTLGRASGRTNVFGETFEPIYGEYAEFEFTSEGAEAVRGRA